MALLEVRDLNVWFRLPKGGRVHAVQDLSLSLDPGQSMGLVGESGCGKTTALTAIMALVPPNAEVSGRVIFDGDDLLVPGERTARKHRWTGLSLVFQGAMNAFNPVVRVEDQIAEPMVAHRLRDQRQAIARARELLEMVGINPKAGRRYPHEFSGGMRQRAMMAMALACDPKLLIADEPTTALDNMVQAQILLLLKRLSEELGLGLLMVTHDLPVVSQLCDSAAVMYAGRIIERGPIADLFHAPAHPYTRMLFDATPDLYDDRPVISIPGTPPRLDREPTACPFAPRCDSAVDRCFAQLPLPEEIGPARVAACLRAEDMLALARGGSRHG
ncbi:Oligopeptide transport system permease protein OppB (TC 3.A.1.5.1) [Microbacterium esteraromaticum]|uniref:Oligopeptide transport system permease protein OppB (TC 3.A.1.5.1) n=1 Tax=Microbacterium esteraromaticum TaxID=57043 RepID=A0A1R4JZU8_9MICO|nr:ABC transporter ATP-binding protein [Microbacterium esteraromaticum]SJN37434.1 Oligopeptide transport system permease protein OppB (TC 3.A.1.5.1) [Microbacterium esteraromaticum]